MSAHCTDSVEPWFLNSLAELGRTLDGPAPAVETPPLALPVNEPEDDRGLPDFGSLPASRPPASYRYVGRVLLGMALLYGLCAVYCGAHVLAAIDRPSVAWSCGVRSQESDSVIDDLVPLADEDPGCLIADDAPPLETGCLGTSVAFVDSLPAAVRQAKDRDQLLMVLNVSGDFDDSRFT